MKIRKNDTVVVIVGKDKGKKGKVRRAFPKENKVMVEGVNIVKRHARAVKQARQAGIIEREAPFYVAKVMLYCNKCNRPVRIGSRFLEGGNKVRICRSCGEVLD